MMGPRKGRGRGLGAAVLLLGVVGYAAPATAALDLTGTWEGKWSCKDVTGGVAAKPAGTLVMTVTQSGDDVNAAIAWYRPDLTPYRSERFRGHVQELAAKPGQGAGTLVGCGTRPGSSYSEALSAK